MYDGALTDALHFGNHVFNVSGVKSKEILAFLHFSFILFRFSSGSKMKCYRMIVCMFGICTFKVTAQNTYS